MQIIETQQELSDFLNQTSLENKDIGFVPTMGALHEGHISLIEQANAENDICICSIFINPTQFNNQEDFKKYPKDFEKDVQILKATGCNVIFHPSNDLMYPRDMPEPINLGLLANTMEGKFRSGHFEGVVAVVSRFFELISPKNAYFGLKDYQQYAIIKHMTRVLDLKVNVIGCQTVRSENGLALSSRNQLLTEDGKRIATIFYQSLQQARSRYNQDKIADIKAHVFDQFKNVNDCRLEYFEIVDGLDLTEININSKPNEVVACVAGFVEGVRLIDNLVIIP